MRNISLKQLFITATITTLFLILVWMNTYVIKSSSVLIGVIQELLLIPIMLLQVLILVFALKKVFQIKSTIKGMLLWTIIMMICSMALTFGSFIN